MLNWSPTGALTALSIHVHLRYEKTLLSPEVIIALRGERFTGVSSVHATARLKLELYTFSSR